MTLEQKIEAGLARLTHPNLKKRLQGLAFLGRLGPKAEIAVPTIVAFLKSENVQERKLATLVLGEIGQPIDLVVSTLITTLLDSEAMVVRRASVALQESIHSNPVALMLVQARMSTAPSPLKELIEKIFQEFIQGQAA